MLPPLPGSGQERRVAGGIAAAATQTSEQSSRVHVCLIPLLRDACVSTCEPAGAVVVRLCEPAGDERDGERRSRLHNQKEFAAGQLNKTQPRAQPSPRRDAPSPLAFAKS